MAPLAAPHVGSMAAQTCVEQWELLWWVFFRRCQVSGSHYRVVLAACQAMADLRCTGSEWSIEDRGHVALHREKNSLPSWPVRSRKVCPVLRGWLISVCVSGGDGGTCRFQIPTAQ